LRLKGFSFGLLGVRGRFACRFAIIDLRLRDGKLLDRGGGWRGILTTEHIPVALADVAGGQLDTVGVHGESRNWTLVPRCICYKVLVARRKCRHP